MPRLSILTLDLNEESYRQIKALTDEERERIVTSALLVAVAGRNRVKKSPSDGAIYGPLTPIQHGCLPPEREDDLYG